MEPVSKLPSVLPLQRLRTHALPEHRDRARRVALGLLLLVAFVLRVWNLNWDAGTHQHPDERYWSIVTDDIAFVGPVEYFSSSTSELNPYTDRDTWVYGTFPLFTTKAVATVLEDGPAFPVGAAVTVADRLGIELREDRPASDGTESTVRADAFDSGYNANLVGRLLSAMIDTGTVLLVYLLGRDLFDRRVGFVAAVLQTFTVLHIQYSHFHGSEAWATFFATAVVLVSLRLAKGDLRLRVGVGVGLLAGLAAASKLIAGVALVVPAVAVVIAMVPALPVVARSLSIPDRWRLGGTLAATIGAVFAGLVVGAPTFLLLLLLVAGVLAAANLARDTLLATPDPEHRVADALRRILMAVGAGISVLVAAALTFRIFQPYVFDGLWSIDPRYTRDLDYLSDVNSGGGAPWVVQWIGRTPLLFPLQSAFWWGMGPALGVAVALGVLRSAGDVIRRHRWILLAPLVLLAIMLGLVSQQFNPLIRYLLPAYPVAVMLGGYGVVSVWDRGRALARERRETLALIGGRSLQLAAGAMVAGTVLWGLAFVNGVYGNDHTRLEASQWIADNIEPGSKLSADPWDDSLPLGLPGVDPNQYELVVTSRFHPDNAFVDDGITKVDDFIRGLDETDYIVESSNKLYGAIPRIPAKYPAMTAYYDALFDGRLGFEQVAEFQNNPSLFGIEIDTSGAEETFTVYDHPTVTIWQKTDDFSVERAQAILNPARAERAPDVLPRDSGTNVLQLEPDRAAALATGETFTEQFSDDAATGTATWLWWLVWLQVSALAVLPWTTLLFRRLPDRGYGLSKVVGFLTVGLTVWATVAWGVVDFGRGVTRFWFGATLVGGLVLWGAHRERMVGLWRSHRRSWVASELVFLGVFAFALWIRMQNPDLWEAYLGGEKPMEMAYLTAIGRTSELPAFDPWFAGGYMNYYYMGWFLLAVPMRAMRILPEVAFQLGVATYAALMASAVFSLVHNLVAVSVERWTDVTKGLRPRAPVRAGLVGVVLFMGMGNLDALRQHYGRLEGVNTWTVAADWPIIGHVITFAGGTWASMRGAEMPRFDWWSPSRVTTPPPGEVGDITEFPYFTLLFGDLHPHLMGMAFLGLVASLALAHLLASREGDRISTWMLAIALGLGTGLVRTTNTWDLPSAALLAGFAVLIGVIIAPRISRTYDGLRQGTAALLGTMGVAVGLSRLGGFSGNTVLALGALGALLLGSLLTTADVRARIVRLAGHLAVVGGVHLVFFWPFLSASETFDTGAGAAVGTSPFGEFLLHWGVFMGIAAAMFGALVIDERRRRVLGDDPVDPLPSKLWRHPLTRIALFVVAIPFSIWSAADTTSNALALCVAGIWVGLLLFLRELRRADRDLGRLVAVGLATLAFAIAGGVDLVTVDNDIRRMNTVFKFWLQAWQFFAVAAAYGVWFVFKVLSERTKDVAVPGTEARTVLVSARRPGARLWVGGVTLAILAGMAYPVWATGPRLDNRFNDLGATLDGLAYLDADPVIFRMDQGPDGPEITVNLAEDLPLIEWLRDNVAGSPTIVEWTGNAYDWNSRIAIHTGLPTVIGWDWHQKQQRWTFQSMIDTRRDAVQFFYTVPDEANITRFLQAYDVSYVIVGTQERRFATPEALDALAAHPALQNEAFRSGDNVIYQVDRGALWPGLETAEVVDLLAFSD